MAPVSSFARPHEDHRRIVKISLDISTLGVWVQGACAVLNLMLFLLLSGGAVPSFHRWWTFAWAGLAVALVLLGLGFSASPPLTLWGYQFFELGFVFAL